MNEDITPVLPLSSLFLSLPFFSISLLLTGATVVLRPLCPQHLLPRPLPHSRFLGLRDPDHACPPGSQVGQCIASQLLGSLCICLYSIFSCFLLWYGANKLPSHKLSSLPIEVCLLLTISPFPFLPSSLSSPSPFPPLFPLLPLSSLSPLLPFLPSSNSSPHFLSRHKTSVQFHRQLCSHSG